MRVHVDDGQRAAAGSAPAGWQATFAAADRAETAGDAAAATRLYRSITGG